LGARRMRTFARGARLPLLHFGNSFYRVSFAAGRPVCTRSRVALCLELVAAWTGHAARQRGRLCAISVFSLAFSFSWHTLCSYSWSFSHCGVAALRQSCPRRGRAKRRAFVSFTSQLNFIPLGVCLLFPAAVLTYSFWNDFYPLPVCCFLQPVRMLRFPAVFSAWSCRFLRFAVPAAFSHDKPTFLPLLAVACSVCSLFGAFCWEGQAIALLCCVCWDGWREREKLVKLSLSFLRLLQQRSC